MADTIVVDALVIFVIFIFTLDTAALCFFVVSLMLPEVSFNEFEVAPSTLTMSASCVVVDD